MCALTMNENVFVLLDDPISPGRSDLQHMNVQPADGSRHTQEVYRPPHFRSTFITLNPPGALEQLLSHLRASWVSVRQPAPGGAQRGQQTGQQLVIEGNIFAIGNDWLVRVGNVILSGGAVKGILLEVFCYDYITHATRLTPFILCLRRNIFHCLRSKSGLEMEHQNSFQTSLHPFCPTSEMQKLSQ